MERFLQILTVFGILSSITNVHGQSITFDTQALRSYNKCERLTRNDCLFYHEALTKCQQVCNDRLTNGDPAPSGGHVVGGGHGGGGGGGGGCFSGTDIVISNYGLMKMSELATMKNVQVLSRNGKNQLEMSTVYSWIHADASMEYKFFVFTTESGQKLTITSLHLIYESDCHGNSKTIFAKKVEIGKCLYVNDNGVLKESKVVGKTEEMKIGIFAPITYNGNILVNDVLASCFTNYENEFLQKFLHSSFDMLHRIATILMPASLMEVTYNTQFGTAMVDIPQSVISLIDLSKSFTKQI